MLTDEFCSECYFVTNENGLRTKPKFKQRPVVEDAQEDERKMLTKRMLFNRGKQS